MGKMETSNKYNNEDKRKNYVPPDAPIVANKTSEFVRDVENEDVRALIIYEDLDDLIAKLLLVKNGNKRSLKHPEINFKWELVGGKIHMERVLGVYEDLYRKSDPLTTAVYEMKEETNIGKEKKSIKSVSYLGELVQEQNFITHIVKIVVPSPREMLYKIKLNNKKYDGYAWLNLHNEVFTFDREKNEYVVSEKYELTPRTKAVLEKIKGNSEIKRYLRKDF